jgi:hypothetical protein
MAKLDLDILEKLRQYAKTDVISTLCDLITKEIIIYSCINSNIADIYEYPEVYNGIVKVLCNDVNPYIMSALYCIINNKLDPNVDKECLCFMESIYTDDNIDEYNDNNSYRDSFMDLIYRCINIKKNKKYIENANNFIIVRNKYKFVWMIEAIMTGYIHNFMLVKLNASNSMLEYFDKFTSRDLIKLMFETINDFEFPDTIDTIN